MNVERAWRRAQHGWPPSYPVAQFPNAPLMVAIGGFAVAAVSDGPVESAARGTFHAGLSAWALLELFEGANAMRRVYGAAGLVLVAADISRRT